MAKGTRREKTWPDRLGTACLGIGLSLLAAFAVAKGSSSLQSRTAVDAFRSAPLAAADATVTADGEASAGIEISEPDFGLWAESRIGQYRQSLRPGGDAPHAVLNIRRLNIRVPVYNGASGANLNRGVARVLGTGRFDGKGNLAIAGHRDGFFRPLKDIRVGDRITVETSSDSREYRVTSIEIIDPSEVSVLAPTDTPSVTLVTCYPFYFVGNAPKRFIVRGEVQSHPVNS